jgi:hypothetical protein
MSFQRPTPTKVGSSSILADSIKLHVDQYLSSLNILTLFDKIKELEAQVAALKHTCASIECGPTIELDNIITEVSDLRSRMDEIDGSVSILAELIQSVASKSQLFGNVLARADSHTQSVNPTPKDSKK